MRIMRLAPIESQRSHLARGVDVVVNVQGDEPLIPPAVIDRLVALVATDTNTDMATAAVPFSISGADPADANAVKVVLGQEQQALYFSRAAVPFCRDGDAQVAPLHHWGIYAYRREFLKRFVSWAPTALERCEKLEQATCAGARRAHSRAGGLSNRSRESTPLRTSRAVARRGVAERCSNSMNYPS